MVFLLPQKIPAQTASDSEAMLASYSDPARIWGNGAERFIEEAYRLCFRTRLIGGKIMNLRMPFAQNNERDTLTQDNWGFLHDGKGNPVLLWENIDKILESPDFMEYVRVLSDNREKIIIFDLPSQTWTVSLDFFDISRMKAGSYRGLPHRPYVLVSGRGIEESDVYNYLYCIGLAGMDCSGFVWHILSYICSKADIDLGLSLSRLLGVRHGNDPALYAGTGFYNLSNPELIAVDDFIDQLRPGDIMLFRSSSGEMAHSSIIQSVDFSNGIIRYLQCTDEAPPAERGVHESFIFFNPSNPKVSLKDTSLVWTQKRYAPFPGERAGPFSDDGERYRAYEEFDGGRVVRVRTVSTAIDRINRLFP